MDEILDDQGLREAIGGFSLDGPPLAVNADGLIGDGRRAVRRRRLMTAGVAALSALALAGVGIGTAGALAGPAGQPNVVANAGSAPLAGDKVLSTLPKVLEADVKPLLPDGMTAVSGAYFTAATVAPYTFVALTPQSSPSNIPDPAYAGRVWLRDSAGTGDLTVQLTATAAGTPTTCAAVGEPSCHESHGPHGEIIVAVEQDNTHLLYVTKTDGTRLYLACSPNTTQGKRDTSDARPRPPLDTQQLIQIATDPKLSLFR